MKKIRFSLLAGLVCLLALTACAKKPSSSTTQLPPAPPAQTETADAVGIPANDLRGATVSEPAAEDLSVLKLEKIFFEYDAFTLTPQAREILSRNAEWLRQNPAAKLTVEGHCDERGADEYNLALGQRRAEAVRSYLVTLGIAAERLSTISYGEERPVAVGNGEGAWAQNRRAEFL